MDNAVHLNRIIVGIDCYKPANGETVTIETMHNIQVDIPLPLLKREASKTGMNIGYQVDIPEVHRLDHTTSGRYCHVQRECKFLP
jgi:hypothetical protein